MMVHGAQKKDRSILLRWNLEEIHDMIGTTVLEVQMVIFTVSLPGKANLAWCSVVSFPDPHPWSGNETRCSGVVCNTTRQ